MNNDGYKISDPQKVATHNHGIQGWVLSFCALSITSFGFQANAEMIGELEQPQKVYITVCDGGEVRLSEDLVSKLNINAETKERLMSRLYDFESTLDQGWNGGAGLPMEKQSLLNALAAVETTPSEEFENWTVFPSPNGTILFSPTNDLIAGISVGNSDFSYAAMDGFGHEIKGKEIFSAKSFKLALQLINSLNKA